MTSYLFLKWLHILSSMVLVGTGFGSAFYLFFTQRTRNVAAIATVTRLVVRADLWMTTPAVIIQPLSGFALMQLTGYHYQQRWLLWTFALYVLAGLCWLPVLWLQIKMAALAECALKENTPLPAQYWRYAKRWELLGYPAFAAMLVIYWLMVAKPQ